MKEQKKYLRSIIFNTIICNDFLFTNIFYFVIQ